MPRLKILLLKNKETALEPDLLHWTSFIAYLTSYEYNRNIYIQYS